MLSQMEKKLVALFNSEAPLRVQHVNLLHLLYSSTEAKQQTLATTCLQGLINLLAKKTTDSELPEKIVESLSVVTKVTIHYVYYQCLCCKLINPVSVFVMSVISWTFET